MNQRKENIIITIDIEAQAPRCNGDPISELIFGRFGGQSAGINRMFDIAEKYDIQLTCFYDYAEYSLYGDRWLQVGKYILSRGHDLEIHLHPEFIDKQFFEQSGTLRKFDMRNVDTANAKLLSEYIYKVNNLLDAREPVAFRGGGFRYNNIMLTELKKNGVKFSFNYAPILNNQIFNIGCQKQFKWVNGIFEIPLTFLPGIFGKDRYEVFNFNNGNFFYGDLTNSINNFAKYLKYYFDKFPGGIATLLMHSWSFLDCCKKNKKFVSINRYASDRFDQFCKHMKENYNIISCENLRNIANNEESTTQTFFQNKIIINSCDTEYKCDICGADESALVSYNKISHRKCKVCGSLERHRAFSKLLKIAKLNFKGKVILHLSPGKSESQAMKQAGAENIFTLDIRSEMNPDIVADIQHMPEINSNQFDYIIACQFLSHVENLEKALNEIYRVLTNDGILIQYDLCSLFKFTNNITDIKKITNFYGQDLYKKYKIGRFRFFGEMDIDKIFGDYFNRISYHIIDEPTGQKVIYNLWSKKDINYHNRKCNYNDYLRKLKTFLSNILYKRDYTIHTL